MFWESPSRRILRETAVEVREAARQVVQTCVSCERRGHDLLDALEASLARGGTRILVAEDDAVQRGLLTNRLRGLGYTVVEVGDGWEAAQRIADNDIGLLITDLCMPRLDGAALACLADREGFPILIVTGTPDAPRLKTLLTFAVADIHVLVKPYMFEQVREFVTQRLPLNGKEESHGD